MGIWLIWCENLIKQILEEFSDSEAINKMLQDIMVKLYVEWLPLSLKEYESV